MKKEKIMQVEIGPKAPTITEQARAQGFFLQYSEDMEKKIQLILKFKKDKTITASEAKKAINEWVKRIQEQAIYVGKV